MWPSNVSQPCPFSSAESWSVIATAPRVVRAPIVANSCPAAAVNWQLAGLWVRADRSLPDERDEPLVARGVAAVPAVQRGQQRVLLDVDTPEDQREPH